jgi:hypothetical protein
MAQLRSGTPAKSLNSQDCPTHTQHILRDAKEVTDTLNEMRVIHVSLQRRGDPLSSDIVVWY